MILSHCGRILSFSRHELSIKIINKFWSFVKKTDNCWEWTGPRTGRYGSLTLGRLKIYTHRFSFGFHTGFLSSVKCVLHECDNPFCVRPDHLFEGTQTDNVYDMVKKGRNRGRHNGTSYSRSRRMFSEDQIREIRLKYNSNEFTHRSLATVYNTTHSVIAKIVRNEIYKDCLV